MPSATDARAERPLPAKAAFAAMPLTYLNSAYTHPLPLAGRTAVEAYLLNKTRDRASPEYDFDATHRLVVEAFAKLIGAFSDELVLVQSTTMGENLAIRSLGIPETGGRIVTDVLHYTGSSYTYRELAALGMDVVTLPMTDDGRIDYAGYEAAVDGDTKLVAVTAVSNTNGFEHDLKRICGIAHAHGAYVYVDLMQAVGANSIDLRNAQVDFAATSSYKWLMGDFGLGFLYVRREIQDQIARPWHGHDQVGPITTHTFPYDDPSAEITSYDRIAGAPGMFAMGTTARAVEVMLSASLPWMLDLGVDRIRQWRQPMIDAIQWELRRRGYRPLTPLDSTSQIVAFSFKAAKRRLTERLADAGVRITLLQNRLRVSVAIFNDMNDVDRLLESLPRQA